MEMVNLKDITVRVVNSREVSSSQLSRILSLFDKSYDQANHTYLRCSLETLRSTALAEYEGRLIGFSLGDAVLTDIPRMSEPQVVVLAGICCIDPAYRRLGLFLELAKAACVKGGLLEEGVRFLKCGRMAHPVSLRSLRKDMSLIPREGAVLTPWHKEVGVKVASLYGVEINEDNFVVKGNGRSIGNPKLVIQVSDDEWGVFSGVNRERGDSLLAMSWSSNVPEGW